MWRQGTPSPIRRGEISELERSPGGTVKGVIIPVDSEGLFPLDGFRFADEKQVYADARPYLSPHLPVTFEPLAGGEAHHIGVDFSRLRRGTVDRFNGRSGWIKDTGDKEVYFETRSLLKAKHLERAKTQVSYFADPDYRSKALLVYPEDEPGPLLPSLLPVASRSPSPQEFHGRRHDGLPGMSASRLASRSHSPSPTAKIFDMEAYPHPDAAGVSALLARPSVEHIPVRSHTVASSRIPASATFPRYKGRLVQPLGSPLTLNERSSLFSQQIHASSMERHSHISSSLHALRRSASLRTFGNSPTTDPFAGSEGFEYMPRPSVRKMPRSANSRQLSTFTCPRHLAHPT